MYEFPPWSRWIGSGQSGASWSERRSFQPRCRRERSLRCHYCDFSMPSDAACPTCSGRAFRELGLGTERLEAELREAFPQLASDANDQGKPEYLTIEQAAELLDVHQRTVRVYINEEGLPALQLPGGLRFKRSALVEWLEARVQRPGAHVDRNVTRLKRAKGQK